MPRSQHSGCEHDGDVADSRIRRAVGSFCSTRKLSFHPRVTPEDLAASGLEAIGKEWG
jgi:hypothetical protein